MAAPAPPTSVRQRRIGRAGFLLAISATAGQILIAAPHATAQVLAIHAAAAFHAASLVAWADGGGAGTPHDSAHCPACQAAVQARTALGVTSCSRGLLPSSPTLGIPWLAGARVSRTLADSKAEPRAPPA